VATPVTWEEVARGARTVDFRRDTVPARLATTGDLFAPLLARTGRFRLERVA
jgi:DNA primase